MTYIAQCKFLPLLDDRHIVTCARDGQVRLAEVADGVCRSTKRLAKHNGPCHKLATSNARPQVCFMIHRRNVRVH